MKNLETYIDIQAPVSVVWKQLMDFGSYPDWNPFIEINGKAEVGSHLENVISLPGQKTQTFRPKVLVVKPNEEFRWVGQLFFKGIFDGEHYFKLEALSDKQTRLVHGENFRGVLVGPLMKMIGEATKVGFEQMNQALKAEVEKKVG